MAEWWSVPVVEALGWALLHFLWEGVLIALLVGAVMACSRSARFRYAMAGAGMLGMVAAFAATFAVSISQAGSPEGPGWSALPGAAFDFATGSGDGLSGMARAGLESLLPWVVGFWLAGFLGVGIYRLTGWRAVGRLRRSGVCAAPTKWCERLERLARQIGVSRPVVLLESSLAEVPVVIGMLRPVILVPVGLFTGLPAGLLESILLHELAHIKRLDYLVNLLQSVAESLLFYHPAVWWISVRMRAERENCCDDVVVAVRGDARDYAAALLGLEEKRLGAREPALAATGGNLMNRLQRILNRREERCSTVGPLLSMALLVGIACMVAMGQQDPNRTPEATYSVEVQRELSAETASERLSPFTRWLNEDVVYIIEDAEREAFERLETDEEREMFIEQFWVRRDPDPSTSENEFREEHYRRIAFANGRFGKPDAPGWTTERGRILVLYGPPNAIAHYGNREIWYYGLRREPTGRESADADKIFEFDLPETE